LNGLLSIKQLHVLLIVALGAGFALIGQNAPAVLASPTTYAVTKTDDTADGACDSDCSLREAIIAANAHPGADTITLLAEPYTLTISGANENNSATGDLDITDDVTIGGASNATTSINGGGLDRVFQIQSGTTATFNNLTIRGGSAMTGGGIYNGGTLTLNDSIVRDNQARTNSSGGGIANFSGTITINSSAIMSNSAPNFGGGLFNTASGVITISNSTFSGNWAGADGGAIYSYATLNLNYVTVANNTAQTAGGIQQGNGGTVKLKNSLVATNHGVATDCGGSLTSQGHNLIGNADGCTMAAAAGDQIGAGASPIDPHIGPLQGNGGATFTHALLSVSPAIDAGSQASCASTDQRGFARPQGTGCDIGAYEFDGPVKQSQIISFAPLPDKTVGNAPFAISATASSGLPVTFTASGKCNVNANTVALSGQAGSCAITAHQAGNATYKAAPEVARSFTINKQNQTISFAPLLDKTLGDAPFTISASASSGLPVSFSSSTPAVCTVSGNTAALVGSGTCTIVASQSGNGSYKPAVDVTRSFKVSASAPNSIFILYLPLVAR
jgi:CSLREA domain-containing protein